MVVPKIIASNTLKHTKFDYQITFGKFTNRPTDIDLDSNILSPPGLSEPRFFLRLRHNKNKYGHLNIDLEFHLVSSKNRIKVDYCASLVDMMGYKQLKNGDFLNLLLLL